MICSCNPGFRLALNCESLTYSVLLLPSDIISPFLFCFKIFYELKLWTKAKTTYLYAMTTV